MLSKLSYLLKHCLKQPASNLDWNSSSFFRVSDKNDYGVVSDRLGLLKSLEMEKGSEVALSLSHANGTFNQLKTSLVRLEYPCSIGCRFLQLVHRVSQITAFEQTTEQEV